MLLLILALGLSRYHEILYESGRVAIQPPVPASPTAEALERYAGGVQKPEHIVIRRDQQGGRVAERSVVQQHVGVDMPVRRDDRQISDVVMDAPSNATGVPIVTSAARPSG